MQGARLVDEPACQRGDLLSQHLGGIAVQLRQGVALPGRLEKARRQSLEAVRREVPVEQRPHKLRLGRQVGFQCLEQGEVACGALRGGKRRVVTQPLRLEGREQGITIVQIEPPGATI